MKKIEEKIFNKILDSGDMLYISLLALSCFSNRSSYNYLPEICLILDKDNLFKFLDIFEGQTITIPKKEELLRFVYAIAAYYYMEYGGMSVSLVRKKLGIAYGPKKLKYDIDMIKNVLDTFDIPKGFSIDD